MVIFGYFDYFDYFGHFWLVLAIFVYFGYFWIFLVIFDYFWLSLVIFAYLCLSLVIFGYLWLSLVIFGYLWLFLVFLGFSGFGLVFSGLSLVIFGYFLLFLVFLVFGYFFLFWFFLLDATLDHHHIRDIHTFVNLSIKIHIYLYYIHPALFSQKADCSRPHSKYPGKERQEFLDGCRHVYLDMGTNVGVHTKKLSSIVIFIIIPMKTFILMLLLQVQIRKLYQPHLFPNASVLPIFEKFFGPIGTRLLSGH